MSERKEKSSNDDELGKRIDELHETIEEELRERTLSYLKFNRRIVRALVLIAAGLVVALIGLYLLAAANNHRVHDIQQSRYDSCLVEDQRNVSTINELKLLGRQNEQAHPARAKEIRQSIQSSILLIDSLAPYRNCNKAVDGK